VQLYVQARSYFAIVVSILTGPFGPVQPTPYQ